MLLRSTNETVPSISLHTHAYLLSVVIATAEGLVPTLTVYTTKFGVVRSTTESVELPVLHTQPYRLSVVVTTAEGKAPTPTVLTMGFNAVKVLRSTIERLLSPLLQT
jgi:hypothetical protein